MVYLAIGNIADRVSDVEKEEAYNRANPPEYEPGFGISEPASGMDDFDSLGSDAGLGGIDFFGVDTSTPGVSNDNNGGGAIDFGFPTTTDAFGSNAFGGNTIGGNVGGNQGQQDTFDKAFDAGADGIVALGKVLIDMFKSFKSRTKDDLAVVGATNIVTGVTIAGIGALALVMGIFSGWKVLKPLRLPATLFMWGGLTFAWGMITLCTISILKARGGDACGLSDTIDDAPPIMPESSGLDNGFNDLLSESESSDVDDFIDKMVDPNSDISSIDAFDDFLNKELEKKDDAEKNEAITFTKPEDIVEKLGEVPMLNRKYLVDTMTEFFPVVTPDFADISDVDLDGDLGISITATLGKAIATACAKDEDDIKLVVESIQDAKFVYIVKFKRHKSIQKGPEALEKEIVNYFKADAEDNSVAAKIQTEAGHYRLILSKGIKAVVTMGDCFKKDNVRDFFLNTKNKLPIIMGVNDIGDVKLADAKDFPSMVIAGMSRSGKSWYVTSILMALATFNTPEDVQFLIIDPKESLLFKTIALMPHVCGLHNHNNIMQILTDILEVEAPRRKKLLADERCETVWDLRAKGIKVPYLYIVMDEVMTIIKSLQSDGLDREFLNLTVQVITQLPSLGIGVLMVPHRAQGVVDKTTREQMHFRAAVRASEDVITETLGINKFGRALINPGDIALKTSSLPEAIYVKGTGITLSDAENNQLISNIARAFYKMGVEVPDMTTIGSGYNRNFEHIKRELNVQDGSKEQFSFDELNSL